MSDKMNKSLDDVIKERKKTEGKGKKGGKPGAKRGATGPKGRLQRTRGRNDRNDKRAATRPTKGANRDRADKNKPRKAARKPISKPGVSQRFIRRTRAGGDRPAKAQAKEKAVSEVSKTRLRVSNLDYNISHKDLTDLFSKFGSLVKNRIDFDDLGRSKGTATIEYDKQESALKAIEEYNGATLDGKTLSVEYDSGKTRVPKAAKKVIEKRDIRPVRRERRDDRRDDRRDNRRDDRRDNRRRGDNRRDGGNRNRRDDRRGGDNRKRGDNRRGGNRRGGNRRGGNRKEGNKKE